MPQTSLPHHHRTGTAERNAMKKEEPKSIAQKLQTVSEGTICVERIRSDENAGTLFSGQFQGITSGKGCIEVYDVFPGIEASFNFFLAPEVKFHHRASESVLEVYYCRSGRVGWNMRGGTAIYLGAGDAAVHSMACCANSAMMFPLGYAEGLSVSADLSKLPSVCLEILGESGVQAGRLQERFCTGKSSAIPARSDLEHIFAPLFSVDASQRLPLLKLKVLELLIHLSSLNPSKRELTQYFSRQTELIKEIHKQLTTHLEQRFTIEDLSKQYLINTSALKEVFKAVYGLPIATYMKEYRVHKAMKLLRDTDASIADIAAQVGYETQGKFSKAFKDVMQVLPTEYRKMQHQKGLHLQ